MNGVGGLAGGGIHQILSLRQQILDRNVLLQQVRSAAEADAQDQPVTATPGGGFGEALKSALDGVSATQRNAEDLATGFERGEVTDIAKVMLARQEAGVAFEATLQVRNKLLSAYQDIMRLGV